MSWSWAGIRGPSDAELQTGDFSERNAADLGSFGYDDGGVFLKNFTRMLSHEKSPVLQNGNAFHRFCLRCMRDVDRSNTCGAADSEVLSGLP